MANISFVDALLGEDSDEDILPFQSHTSNSSNKFTTKLSLKSTSKRSKKNDTPAAVLDLCSDSDDGIRIEKELPVKKTSGISLSSLPSGSLTSTFTSKESSLLATKVTKTKTTIDLSEPFCDYEQPDDNCDDYLEIVQPANNPKPTASSASSTNDKPYSNSTTSKLSNNSIPTQATRIGASKLSSFDETPTDDSDAELEIIPPSTQPGTKTTSYPASAAIYDNSHSIRSTTLNSSNNSISSSAQVTHTTASKPFSFEETFQDDSDGELEILPPAAQAKTSLTRDLSRSLLNETNRDDSDFEMEIIAPANNTKFAQSTARPETGKFNFDFSSSTNSFTTFDKSSLTFSEKQKKSSTTEAEQQPYKASQTSAFTRILNENSHFSKNSTIGISRKNKTPPYQPPQQKASEDTRTRFPDISSSPLFCSQESEQTSRIPERLLSTHFEEEDDIIIDKVYKKDVTGFQLDDEPLVEILSDTRQDPATGSQLHDGFEQMPSSVPDRIDFFEKNSYKDVFEISSQSTQPDDDNKSRNSSLMETFTSTNGNRSKSTDQHLPSKSATTISSILGFSSSDEDEFSITSARTFSNLRSTSTSLSENARAKPRPAGREFSSTSELDKIRRAEEREAKRKEKELEKQRKQEEREQKRQERDKIKELNLVNRSNRMNRSAAYQELTLKFHATIYDIKEKDFGKRFKQHFVDNMSLKTTPSYIESSYIFDKAYAIAIERTISSRYDSDQEMFVPISPKTEAEPFLILYFEAKNYVQMLNNNQKLEKHVASVKSAHPKKQLIYIVQGSVELVRRVANQKNREITTRVRELMNKSNNSSSSNKGKRTSKKNSPNAEDETYTVEFINNKNFEKSFLHLQYKLGCRLVLTNNAEDTILWISELLYDIGTSYYKRIKKRPYDNSLPDDLALMEKKVKSGNDAKEVFINSLCQIKYVTNGSAKEIAHRFQNMNRLSRELETNQGFNALADLPKSEESRMRIGNKLANSIKHILTSKDPNEFLR